MCGIAGFYGQFEPELLDKMSLRIAHRGPDDSGSILFEHQQNQIGLAHRRLTIIDLSENGRQPMTTTCPTCGSGESNGRLWLCYNGELYNYKELKHELSQRGHRFHSNSDSEVILHLYAEYGTEMLKRMNGIFAFAIYDDRRKGHKNHSQPGDLFLARDGLGVKPLYYTLNKKGCLFASELKAILECDALEKKIDHQSLYYYISYLWAPAPHTMFKNVMKLEPGAAMIVRKGCIARKWFFYDLPYAAPHLDYSEEQLAEMLAEKLRTAVKRQMVSDVPVGAFLSGGLDSSSIVAFASQMSDKPMDCFTIDADVNGQFEGFVDDLPFARQVADDLDVRLNTVKAGPGIIDRLEEMIYLLDEPQADPAPLNALLICEQARQKGIKVLLSGAGGDDIFSGYRRHTALAFEKYWSWLPRGGRRGIKQFCRLFPDRSSIGRRLNKAFSSADLPGDERLLNYFRWIGQSEASTLFSRDMQAEFNDHPPDNPLLKTLQRIPEEKDPLNRMLYLEAKHFLADHNLNYTDRMGMASGVEVRVPFLDPDLIRFATQIPPRLKQNGRTGKFIFKKSMEPYLSHRVIYRPKTGFGVPLRQWIHNELKESVNELLGPKSLQKYGLFDEAGVARLIRQDAQGKVDATYTIFSLMCIQWWMDLFY